MSGDAVSIPTPDISHLTEDDYEHVYEPAGAYRPRRSRRGEAESESEDTFILLDALEQDAIELQSEKPSLCVEIGRVISFNHLNHLDAWKEKLHFADVVKQPGVRRGLDLPLHPAWPYRLPCVPNH